MASSKFSSNLMKSFSFFISKIDRMWYYCELYIAYCELFKFSLIPTWSHHVLKCHLFFVVFRYLVAMLSLDNANFMNKLLQTLLMQHYNHPCLFCLLDSSMQLHICKGAQDRVCATVGHGSVFLNRTCRSELSAHQRVDQAEDRAVRCPDATRSLSIRFEKKNHE